jgi:Molecular chaperone
MATDLTLSTIATGKLPDGGTSSLGRTFVGIDFGTSTTVASVATLDTMGRFDVHALDIRVKDEEGGYSSSRTTPTIIACINEMPIFGGAAEKFKYTLTKDKDIWYSFKMELGENLGNKYSESVLGSDPDFPVRNPQDATRLFFFFMKHQIEEAVRELGLPSDIRYAVTIPASFEANQRKDLIDALDANGIEVSDQVLIDEPNAAFLSYVFESAKDGHPISVPDTENLDILVFDYGAGTCDISVLEIGKDHKGIYSKNKAISRFDKCGGDDIDRFIAEKYLLPQILKSSGVEEKKLRSKDRRRIVARLMKPAELLKIKVCENVSLKMNDLELPLLSNSDEVVTLSKTVSFDTRLGRMTLADPGISYRQFNEAMKVFLNQMSSSVAKMGEDDYNSVFTNIKSALEKANRQKEDIDYVLFIGGSSYNPYLQYALKCYFKESELLIPHNLQTHVSQGAAIHSLLFNAMGFNMVNPITGEKILAVARDGRTELLVPEGAPIPRPVTMNENLSVSEEGQKVVEVPICVRDRSQVLSVLRIECPRPEGFHEGENVRLDILITADKLLKVAAWIGGVRYDIDPINPFANRPLTAQEVEIIKAERKVNDEASLNGGIATKKSMMDLSETYGKAKEYFKQAETLEEVKDSYPGAVSNNNIAVAYHNAGQYDKAADFLEKAYQEEPDDPYVCFNYARTFEDTDPERYFQLLKKSYELDKNNPVHVFLYGHTLYQRGRRDEGMSLINKSVDLWTVRLNNGTLRSWDYGWFRDAARFLHRDDLVRRINDAEKMDDAPYDENNLLKTNSTRR